MGEMKPLVSSKLKTDAARIISCICFRSTCSSKRVWAKKSVWIHFIRICVMPLSFPFELPFSTTLFGVCNLIRSTVTTASVIPHWYVVQCCHLSNIKRQSGFSGIFFIQMDYSRIIYFLGPSAALFNRSNFSFSANKWSCKQNWKRTSYL